MVALILPTNETNVESPLERLEHALVKPVNFLIIPLFAFANTNIILQTEMLYGLIVGIFFGKPYSILLTSWLCRRLGIASLSEGSNWMHIIEVRMVVGIGFNMSIFILILLFRIHCLYLKRNSPFCLLLLFPVPRDTCCLRQILLKDSASLIIF